MLPWPLGLGGSCCSARKPSAKPARLGPLRLPLIHSKGAPNEGVFKVELTIGGIPIQLIVDTCSANVIVVGEQCGSSCQLTAGTYSKVRPTYTGKTSTVAYVSQTNHIAWAKDAYDFTTCEDAEARRQFQRLQPPPLHFGVITSNVSHVVQGGTLPGRSILGLMSRQRSAGRGLGLLDPADDHSFINQVFGERGIFKRAVYSFAIEPTGDSGELVLGGLHRGIKGWVPLVPASEHPPLRHHPQWVVRLRRALVVAHDGVILAELSTLKFARFDTGNTWLSMPPDVFQEHGHLGELCRVAGLQFVLDNDVALWFPTAMFSGPIALANATGFGGLALDSSLPAAWCIFGNEIMKGMVVACDLDKAELGFGGMCCAKGDEDWMDCDMYTPPEVE